jgi:hypothetical protein
MELHILYPERSKVKSIAASTFPDIPLLPKLDGELYVPDMGGGVFEGMQDRPGNTDLVAMARVRAHCLQVG